MRPGDWSPWIHVLVAAVGCQLVKLTLYGAANRRLLLRILVTTSGLPSLHGVTFGCLATVVALAEGTGSPLFAATVLLSGIILHDAIRVHGSAERSGDTARSLASLLESREGDPPWLQRLRGLLSDRGHRPWHVAVGAVLGVLWGLIWRSPA